MHVLVDNNIELKFPQVGEGSSTISRHWINLEGEKEKRTKKNFSLVNFWWVYGRGAKRSRGDYQLLGKRTYND